MVLKQCFLTNNITYKKQTPITPKGILVHSTGCKQTWLGRWVQPSADDPNRETIIADIGYNAGMGWNVPTQDVIVHAMIGLNLRDEVEIYQTLQFDRKCGGCYHGPKGSYNNSHIQFEMQEDDHTDVNYFNNVINTAIDFCVYLCKEYNIPTTEICSHREAGIRGYASTHGDPDNWFKDMPGEWTMDKFRAAVAEKLAEEDPTKTVFTRGDIVALKPGVTTNCNGKELAKWVCDGSNTLYVYSSDAERTKITVDKTLSAVTATMNTSDLILVESAKEDSAEPEYCKITCEYKVALDNGDEESLRTVTIDVQKGQEYSIEAPQLDYYIPETVEIKGTALGNTVHTIFCTPVSYAITVSCLDEEGNPLLDTSGVSYDTVYYVDGGNEYYLNAPVIEGYTADRTDIEGIATKDIVETVKYVENECRKNRNKFIQALFEFIKTLLKLFGKSNKEES